MGVGPPGGGASAPPSRASALMSLLRCHCAESFPAAVEFGDACCANTAGLVALAVIKPAAAAIARMPDTHPQPMKPPSSSTTRYWRWHRRRDALQTYDAGEETAACEARQLDYPMIRCPDHSIARSPDHPI